MCVGVGVSVWVCVYMCVQGKGGGRDLAKSYMQVASNSTTMDDSNISSHSEEQA